jgi:hypothetical protein
VTAGWKATAFASMKSLRVLFVFWWIHNVLGWFVKPMSSTCFYVRESITRESNQAPFGFQSAMVTTAPFWPPMYFTSTTQWSNVRDSAWNPEPFLTNQFSVGWNVKSENVLNRAPRKILIFAKKNHIYAQIVPSFTFELCYNYEFCVLSKKFLFIEKTCKISASIGKVYYCMKNIVLWSNRTLIIFCLVNVFLEGKFFFSMKSQQIYYEEKKCVKKIYLCEKFEHNSLGQILG